MNTIKINDLCITVIHLKSTTWSDVNEWRFTYFNVECIDYNKFGIYCYVLKGWRNINI